MSYNYFSWQQDLSSSWEIKPLKSVANYFVSSVDKRVNLNENEVSLCNYVDVYKNEYINDSIEFMIGSASSEEIEKYKLISGDIVITKDSESWDDIGIPSYVLKSIPNLICGYHLAVVRPNNKKINSKFLFRCLQSKAIRIQLELASTGVTRYGLPKDAIGSLKLPLPNLDVQNKVVLYLDKELKRVDSLISSKRRLIDTLTKKRELTIRYVLTKGLSDNVELRKSNIDWLPMVPKHWGVKKIKYLADLKSGEFITSESIDDENLVPVYGGNGLRGYTYQKTHSGNFVLIGRQGALCGNINYALGDFWASEHAVVCNPIEDYELLWFGELLRIMDLNQYSIAAAQPGLSVDVIKNLSIPVPPRNEQIQISQFIKKATTGIDELIKKTEESISLLKGRKEALLIDGITGKLFEK